MENTNIVHLNSIEGYKNTDKYAYLLECGKKTVSKPDSLTLVTSFTEREDAMLINQLDMNGIQYINAAQGITTVNFIKAFKPIYYYNVLQGTNTEYTLIIDAYDTAIKTFENLDMLPDYYKRDIIYNASLISFPINLCYDTGASGNNMWKNINSGVVYGKTDKLRTFYHELSDYINNNYNDKPKIKTFEQWWLIDFLNNYKGNIKIGVDYDFKAFELIQYMSVEKTDKGYKCEPKIGFKR